MPTSSVEGHYPPITRTRTTGAARSAAACAPVATGAGALAGWYVFGDYCTGQVLALERQRRGRGDGRPAAFEIASSPMRSPRSSTGPTGELYVLGGAGIQRIDPA